jgi:hypothetical protein
MTNLLGTPPSEHGTLMLREMLDPSDALPIVVAEFVEPMVQDTAAIVRRLAPGLDEERLRLCVTSIMGQGLFYRATLPATLRVFGIESFTPAFIRRLAAHVADFSRGGIARVAGHKRSACALACSCCWRSPPPAGPQVCLAFLHLRATVGGGRTEGQWPRSRRARAEPDGADARRRLTALMLDDAVRLAAAESRLRKLTVTSIAAARVLRRGCFPSVPSCHPEHRRTPKHGEPAEALHRGPGEAVRHREGTGERHRISSAITKGLTSAGYVEQARRMRRSLTSRWPPSAYPGA